MSNKHAYNCNVNTTIQNLVGFFTVSWTPALWKVVAFDWPLPMGGSSHFLLVALEEGWYLWLTWLAATPQESARQFWKTHLKKGMFLALIVLEKNLEVYCFWYTFRKNEIYHIVSTYPTQGSHSEVSAYVQKTLPSISKTHAVCLRAERQFKRYMGNNSFILQCQACSRAYPVLSRSPILSTVVPAVYHQLWVTRMCHKENVPESTSAGPRTSQRTLWSCWP